LLPLLASVLPLGSFHPYYTQPIANSIQRWDISTLRKQIHAGHVRRVAIYQDSSIVEVLDQNGLQRRIDVFPPAASLLVKDLHEEHVEFFVAPVKQPSLLVPFARAFVLTLLVIFLIHALGMLPAFLFGCMIVGAEMLRLGQELDIFLMEAWGGLEGILAAGWSRHHASWSAMSTASRAEDMVSMANGAEPDAEAATTLRYRVHQSQTTEQQGEPILLLADADQDGPPSESAASEFDI